MDAEEQTAATNRTLKAQKLFLTASGEQPIEDGAVLAPPIGTGLT
jgi:hypothetical protein